MLRFGVDIGGTKIEVAALEGSVVRGRRRVPTPRDDYEGTLRAVAGLVRGLEAECGAAATVGVGMPGALSPADGLVMNSNSVWLNGRALAQDLAAVLPLPLRFENDANCFALSEAVDGAAKGARAVFGVIVGTGTGGGVVLDGRVWTGRNAIAGEWGHNPLPRPGLEEMPGPPCYCGRTGCIETWLSGPGLARDYGRTTGMRADPAEIATRAAQGDPGAEATLARYEDRMARALAAVVNIFDPDVIVLGGGLSNLSRLYRNVPLLLPQHVMSEQVTTWVLPAVHGDSSGVRGAAWLWEAKG